MDVDQLKQIHSLVKSLLGKLLLHRLETNRDIKMLRHFKDDLENYIGLMQQPANVEQTKQELVIALQAYYSAVAGLQSAPEISQELVQLTGALPTEQSSAANGRSSKPKPIHFSCSKHAVEVLRTLATQPPPPTIEDALKIVFIDGWQRHYAVAQDRKGTVKKKVRLEHDLREKKGKGGILRAQLRETIFYLKAVHDKSLGEETPSPKLLRDLYGELQLDTKWGDFTNALLPWGITV